MTREEFMKELAYNCSEEDCKAMFKAAREELEDGSATWNYELEYAYNLYLIEEDEI